MAKQIKSPKLADLVARDAGHRCPDGIPCVRMESVANLPTRWGRFFIVGFSNNRDGKDHVAIVRGDVVGRERVPVRMHSECLTGDALGSLRCDCRSQLEKSLVLLGKMPRGILLYLRQEGRGIGLLNKIRAYALQERGYDTIEANRKLGFNDDERDYAIAAHMLRSLRVRSIRLMTNNPDKIAQLTRYGTRVVDRIPVVISPNRYNRSYLATKRLRAGHFIPAFGVEQHEYMSTTRARETL